jgi:hypothetical protein
MYYSTILAIKIQQQKRLWTYLWILLGLVLEMGARMISRLE